MIDNSSRQVLKAKAHSLKPVVLLGSKGLTPAVLQEIDIALTAHELIKVKLAGQVREDRVEMKTQICSALKAECIQAIGMILVLYRKNPKK
jgi:RNA-binding protein